MRRKTENRDIAVVFPVSSSIMDDDKMRATVEETLEGNAIRSNPGFAMLDSEWENRGDVVVLFVVKMRRL